MIIVERFQRARLHSTSCTAPVRPEHCPHQDDPNHVPQEKCRVFMLDVRPIDSRGLEDAYYRIYRDFFDRAEKKRRWSLRDDIPWHQVNRAMDPAIADVVESFCAVELYLPDYLAKALPRFRAKRGRAW